MGTLSRIQGPDPVISVADVKKFIHVDTAADDDRIAMLIDAATQRLDGRDGILGRALGRQTWRYDLVGFPAFGAVLMPLAPLIGVTSIAYLDTAGEAQVLAADQYRVFTGGAARSYLGPAVGGAWPTGVIVGEFDAVQITFDAGYVSEHSPENNAVPEPLRQAITLMVMSWYDLTGPGDIPQVVDSLVAPFKINRLGIL